MWRSIVWRSVPMVGNEFPKVGFAEGSDFVAMIDIEDAGAWLKSLPT